MNMQMIPEGTNINGYIFGNCIGSGGYSSIYLVQSIKFSQIFVAKVIHPKCQNSSPGINNCEIDADNNANLFENNGIENEIIRRRRRSSSHRASYSHEYSAERKSILSDDDSIMEEDDEKSRFNNSAEQSGHNAGCIQLAQSLNFNSPLVSENKNVKPIDRRKHKVFKKRMIKNDVPNKCSTLNQSTSGQINPVNSLGIPGFANHAVSNSQEGNSINQQSSDCLNNEKNNDSVFTREKESFHREVGLLKILDHPHIIRLYDFFAYDDDYFMILEYCQKGALIDEIKNNGPLKGVKLINCARQLIDSIQYAHQNGVAHRDIKPHNILFDEFERVKLADFGISIKNESGDVIKCYHCSPAFGAPEVLRKEPHNAFKSDMWSLGVTLYYMSVGSLPFKFQNISQILRDMKRVGIQQINKALVPPVIYDIIKKTVVYDPHCRIDINEAANMINSFDNVINSGKSSNSLLVNSSSCHGSFFGNNSNIIPNPDNSNASSEKNKGTILSTSVTSHSAMNVNKYVQSSRSSLSKLSILKLNSISEIDLGFVKKPAVKTQRPNHFVKLADGPISPIKLLSRHRKMSSKVTKPLVNFVKV
ncbi:hypothetical protein TRFO_22917 [Tritrichomonas foetus]|uniref:Protein kinase domain-containing protein n=1 Tax=Tritrichomonas foetus TaxID=1144522 RepID=A0A1J4KC49_9EUKA|nr:hypothetical protein TRFO_22917 [Tritrichomonas foetus]|eukprot:OHT08504.1 hypothetical protein TRFO_22917 [Tritrichomonas foetus]